MLDSNSLVIRLKGYAKNVREALKNKIHFCGSVVREIIEENKREIGIYALELAIIGATGEAARLGINYYIDSLGHGPHNISGNVELYNNLIMDAGFWSTNRSSWFSIDTSCRESS